MGLTYGQDPFGPDRLGTFDVPMPAEAAYVRPLGRRIGAIADGLTVVDTFGSSRRVRVEAGGLLVAESTRTKALFETGLPVRSYFASADVRLDLLEPSDTVTERPYNGTASHYRMNVGNGTSTWRGPTVASSVARVSRCATSLGSTTSSSTSRCAE